MRDYFMRMLLPERPNGTILKYSRLQGNVDSSHQAVIFELSEITSFEVLQDLKKRLDTNLNDTNLNNSIDPTIIHIKHGTKDDGSYFCGLVVNETRLYREKNRSLLIVASSGSLASLSITSNISICEIITILPSSADILEP